MTACAFESATADGSEWATRPGCVITADGSYAARLAHRGGSWYPERWTLDGPEPYAVPLPGNQPEEPGTEVQPLTDGRVLIHRPVGGRHLFSLLYPTGPGTGELPLGAVDGSLGGVRLRLLPPAPTGDRACALAVGPRSTTVWLVAGGTNGPERLAELPGRCSGGVWLDRSGRMLALDRALDDGPTKTVVVDLGRGGAVSPLLQITDGSTDRLLLADPDSGLLLIRSDAPSPGRERLGWGVLGSTLPVRFPGCLDLDSPMTPFAIQPGQLLAPESCAVAFRVDGPAGSWLAVWRPAHRRARHLPAPQGWLAGAGLWTREGVLRLPFATGAVRCGVARLEPAVTASGPSARQPEQEREPEHGQCREMEAEGKTESEGDAETEGKAAQESVRPVPLQEAPLQQPPPVSPRPRKVPASSGITLRRTLTWPRPDTAAAPHPGMPTPHPGVSIPQPGTPVTHPGAPVTTTQLPLTTPTAPAPAGTLPSPPAPSDTANIATPAPAVTAAR
ncbi:hypothetical protein ACIQ6V_01130 [Streptomyces sp. NPDC096198]|uniref:hypothetical protein n=1 Tax=Streptomyces sp. NPDC096198 TaxID=3366080 RepID=UPI003800B229